MKPTTLSKKRWDTHCACVCVLKQPCPTGGNGGIVSPRSPASARQCFVCLLANRAANFEGGWLGEAGVGSRWPTHLDPTLFRTIVSLFQLERYQGIRGSNNIGAHYLLFLLSEGGQNSSLETFLTFV